MVCILRNSLKLINIYLILTLVSCSTPDYFGKVPTEQETTIEYKDEIVTEATTESVTTEHQSIFPDSVYDYNVEDTILVPK